MATDADTINTIKYALAALSLSSLSSLYRNLLYISIIATNEIKATKIDAHIMHDSMNIIFSIIIRSD